MRPIKFRAWDKENKVMLYMQDYKPQSFFEDLFARENGKKDLFPQHIMQFTGLLDKNGKEIYEGDIIGIKTHNTYVKRIIVWIDKEASFNIPDNIPSAGNPWKVIGNIYENPELIKEELK